MKKDKGLEKRINDDFRMNKGISRILKVFLDNGFYFVDEDEILSFLNQFQDWDVSDFRDKELKDILAYMFHQSWIGFDANKFKLSRRDGQTVKTYESIIHCMDYVKVSRFVSRLECFCCSFENLKPDMPFKIKIEVLTYFSPKWEILSLFSDTEKINSVLSHFLEDYFFKEVNNLNLLEQIKKAIAIEAKS
ncbi:hypothetical protein AAGG74_15715 [Bacillus mexicanus]|uniref:hypothetical protein n=1 Tax=Bacillus mexicanus TaxID=2834415 RepID=UPI003D213B8B